MSYIWKVFNSWTNNNCLFHLYASLITFLNYIIWMIHYNMYFYMRESWNTPRLHVYRRYYVLNRKPSSHNTVGSLYLCYMLHRIFNSIQICWVQKKIIHTYSVFFLLLIFSTTCRTALHAVKIKKWYIIQKVKNGTCDLFIIYWPISIMLHH